MKNRIKCIIVDDERKAIELLTECLLPLYDNMEICGTYTQWSTALQDLRTKECDILFLDISMPGKSGLDLLNIIPNFTGEVIFITAHSEFALNAFRFSPSGYILKPIDDRELAAAVDKAIERIHYKKLANRVTDAVLESKIGIPNNKGIDYLNVDDIIYLEAVNSCTKVVTGESAIISSYTLARFKAIIEQHTFFYQVHRSYIINLNSIKRYTTDSSLIMKNGDEVPVSKNTKDEFLLIFNKVSKKDQG